MNNQKQKPRFEVIRGVRRKEITAENFNAPSSGIQAALFPAPRPGLLIFVFFPDVTEEEFEKVLQFGKPGTVVELRNTPRFDIGRLNRHTVFEYFDREHSKYLDLTSARGDRSDSGSLAWEVKAAFRREHVRFEKPIVFLLSRLGSPPDLSNQIIDVVTDLNNSKPEVLAVPSFT
jgi:hypothetical protein